MGIILAPITVAMARLPHILDECVFTVLMWCSSFSNLVHTLVGGLIWLLLFFLTFRLVSGVTVLILTLKLIIDSFICNH